MAPKKEDPVFGCIARNRDGVRCGKGDKGICEATKTRGCFLSIKDAFIESHDTKVHIVLSGSVEDSESKVCKGTKSTHATVAS